MLLQVLLQTERFTGGGKGNRLRSACIRLRAAETQNVVDEANDVVAEARRESKIQAAVNARLAEMEEDIRKEVAKKIDAEGAQA